jgi:hypothetical protein
MNKVILKLAEATMGRDQEVAKRFDRGAAM